MFKISIFILPDIAKMRVYILQITTIKATAFIVKINLEGRK